MKVCSKCKVEKKLSDFYSLPHCHLGVANICKDCAKEARKKYYEIKKVEILDKQKEYYKQNESKIKSRKRADHIKNKQRNNERSATWRANHPARMKEHKEKWRKENDEYYKAYRQKNRNKILNLYQEWYKENAIRLTDYQKEYYKKNRLDVIKRACDYAQNQKDNLSEVYLKKLLKRCGWTKEQIANIPALFAIKQIEVINKRINKQQKPKNNGKRSI
jgi:Asp-tRNA(Asn)/Glu-tRNA(Gln) amidotransferase A subunit family amidase